MGRQIQVAATMVDEDAFLSFVRETAEIRLFGGFADTPEGLWADAFAPTLTAHWKYSIWNTAFPWKPEYGQVTRSKDPRQNGLWYVSNSNAAPVIEFSRSDVSQKKYGRIYWAKYFSAPRGLEYDVNVFGEWFDVIVKWTRKNGHKDKSDRCSPYFLPDAWKTREAK